MRSRHTGGARGAGPRFLYWCDTTQALPFETGIQRVTRRLAAGLGRQGIDIEPVGWDPARCLIRTTGTGKELVPRLADWLLVPEIPMSVLGQEIDTTQLARAYGLRAAAVVHDLIPVRLAHLYSAEERALYGRYFRSFSRADLVLATTDLVAGHLRAFLAGEGLRVPVIAVVPLPAQFGAEPRTRSAPPLRAVGEPLRLLTVSTWEPRKNLAGLLGAVRRARERCFTGIEVTLVGRRAGYPEHDASVDALLAELPGCSARPWVDDAELAALYATHHATVYPSCEEGFGMPVLESLWLGRPCLCHSGSAMAEVGPGGGTLVVDMGDEDAVAEALATLCEEPGILVHLTAEALARPLRDWNDYAAGVIDALEHVSMAAAGSG